MSLMSSSFSPQKKSLVNADDIDVKNTDIKNTEIKSSKSNFSLNYSVIENKKQTFNKEQNNLKTNQLPQPFIDSYQYLENQVNELNIQLQDEIEKKNKALKETQNLLNEKVLLSDRLQKFLALMPSGVVVIDGEGKVRDCNLQASHILGEPLLGEFWVNIIRRSFNPQADDGHQVSLKDGRKIHIETCALNGEPGQFLLLTDLTKTRELQATLSQQQKLSSMGKMIASLAHQIRTPLSAAILYGSHLVENKINQNLKDKFSGLLLERLSFIERQVNDMLNFIKGEKKDKKKISASDFFDQVWQACQGLPQSVSFGFSQKNGLENNLLIDPDALCGGVLNLISNAFDAVDDKSSAKIKVNFILDEDLILLVEDNGKGIEKASIEKIFEPFYTTKNTGNGLGLAILHGLIIEHGGRINVASEVGKGTKFKIILPIVKENSVLFNLDNEPNQYEEDIYEF